MAVTILSGPTGLFDPYTRDQAGARQVLALALFGGEKGVGETDADVRKRVVTAENWVARKPDFKLTANTTGAADTFAINLSDLGVTFPAGTMRSIDMELYVTGGTVATESGYIRARGLVIGGTTPVASVVLGGDTNMAAAEAGFTTADPAVALAMDSNDVTVEVTSENAAEANHMVLHVYVGPLQPLVIPAT
jgi:hypothetical protein